MASLDEERYLRHLWLLGEGGLFVLRGVVSREATKSGSTLDILLHNGRDQFRGVLQEQQHCLFPSPTTVNADTNTWDMSLLFVVLKKLFWSNLSLSERAYLSALKTYRNDFQGHPQILSMNALDYSSNRQLLEQALRQLASGINRNVEIESIIKRTATGRIDSDSISTHIKEIHDFKTSFLTALEDMLQRINSFIQGNHGLVLSKLNNMDIKHVWKTKHDFSRELKVIIQAECENKEKQKEANDLLFDFVKIIQSDIKIESDKIRRIIAVRMEWYGEPTLQLLDDLIEWFSDIANLSNGIGNACLGSIVIPIFCSSVPDILTLLKYMNDDQNKQHLSRISSTVRVLLGFPCSLSWKIEPTSLRSALSTSLLSPGKEKRSKEEKVLVLPINVTNIEQLTDVWEMLEDEQKSSNMEKISATLTQTFGEAIRLKTYVDTDELQTIIHVYERGDIESQPDNSTDDQSSDKEHKKQIQRKFGSSDSDAGHVESQPDKSTDDLSSDEEHKRQIQKKISSSKSDEETVTLYPITMATRSNNQEPEDPACDPNKPISVPFEKVLQAQDTIKDAIEVTPCRRSQMSDLFNMELYFKKEYMQYTGSFKERGARFCLLNLSQEQKNKGVIAASAGNHALALSYHGKLLGIPVNVVMPTIAPLMKITACKKYGANIKIEGHDIVESRTVALKMAKERGLAYINGYDHEDIIAGQGTIGLEILEQVPDLDVCIIPIGGGGMVAGTALAIKTKKPDVRIIGVEPEHCPSFQNAMDARKPIYTETTSTLADGLAVPTVGVNAFETVMANKLIDRKDIVQVKEEFIELAILRCIELEKAVVEGGGATGLAAIIQGIIPGLEDKKVVVILSGGNIDTTVLDRVIERALAEDNRLVKFKVSVSDRPGGIAELTKLVGDLGVSIKDIFQERPWEKHDVFSVMVKMVCETRDADHSKELHEAIKKKYPNNHLIWGQLND